MSSLIDDSLLDPAQTNQAQLDKFASLNLDLNLSTSHSLPYPATTHTAQTTIQSLPTTAQLTSFSDKLLLTISQHGKLAQWFSMPLGNENPSVGEGYLSLNGNGNGFGGSEYEDDEEGQGEGEGVQDDGVGGLLTPQNRFQARTILGGGGGEREVWGGLISRCVAGLIVQRAQAKGQGGEAEGGGEGRVLIVGLGLVGVKFEGMGEEERREVFLRILELVSRVL